MQSNKYELTYKLVTSCTVTDLLVLGEKNALFWLICHSTSEKLNEKQPDRIRFYLSKADTAGHESDRQVNC